MNTPRQAKHRRRGVVFPCTLWLLVAMTALALALTMTARAQRTNAANTAAAAQARQIEHGALQYVLSGLVESEGLLPDDLYLPCCAMQIGDGAFWVIRPDYDDDKQHDYGLIDEGGKIDLNTAPLAVLQKLPDISVELAAAIVDWRDEDDTVTENGAESDFYLRKSEPHEARNGPFESVLELRMLAGADDGILYGEDTNRNGILDDCENDAADSMPDDDRNGELNRGLAGWTSAWLKYPDQNQQSQPGQFSGNSGTIDVNSASRRQIEEEFAKSLDLTRAVELAADVVQKRPFTSIFHLYYSCGLNKEEFEKLEQSLVFATGDKPFKLNVNAAESTALQCLPELTEADAEAIVQARGSQELIEPSQSLSWMIDAVSKEKLIAAAAAGVTGRSYQYTADLVAVAGNGRVFRRCRYVIDVSGDKPRVVHRQDLSHWPWPLDSKILDRLRAGESIEDVLADAQS